MKTLYSGTTECSRGSTDTLRYRWRFDQAEDHEHPYVLSVTVGDHAHSEGYVDDIGDTEALTESYKLAREIHGRGQT